MVNIFLFVFSLRDIYFSKFPVCAVPPLFSFVLLSVYSGARGACEVGRRRILSLNTMIKRGDIASRGGAIGHQPGGWVHLVLLQDCTDGSTRTRRIPF